MKGFVFTLDAIFSLVFAAFAIATLVYVSYSGYTPASIQTPQVSAISTALLSASVSQLGQSSPLYGAGSVGTWPQYGSDSGYSFGNAYGPVGPYLLYSYAASGNIIPAPVVGAGYVAFATSSKIYELNATNGASTVNYPISDPSVITAAPLFYKSYLLYANYSSGSGGSYIVAVSSANGQSKVWNTLISGAKLTSPLQFENGYIVFGANTAAGGQVYFLNPSNGTVAENDLTAAGGSGANLAWIAHHKGSFYVGVGPGKPFNGLIQRSFVNASIYPSNGFASYGPYLVRSGGALAMYANITAAYNKTKGVINLTGVPYYQYSISTAFALPSSTFNTVPSIGSNVTYLLYNGINLEAFTLGGQLFNVSLPNPAYFYNYSDIALAYGNAYVANGNTIYVFGPATLPRNSTLLAALGSMYLSGRGGLADYVLYSRYGNGNIGIFVNKTYGPSLHVANFSGANGYITIPARTRLSPQAGATGAMSLCGWYRLNSLSGYNGLLYKGTLGAGNAEFAVDPAGLWRGFTIYGSSGSVVATYNSPTQMDSNVVGVWNAFCFTYNTSASYYYFNSTPHQATLNTGVYGVSGSGSIVIGGGPSGHSSVSVADLQLYNTSISQARVSGLYNQGPFAEPTNSSGLVGWWPLLGDGNDYSGNGFVGFPSNMAYTSANYIPQSLSRAVLVGGSAEPLQLNNNGVSNLYNVSVVVWS
ncbi:MAG: hypothetical protein KGH94_02040 [Candidatus Micrarchaeota archaeon]|nr:hypothetical protein [Candidatus Micrarchaeota archaeon]